MSSIYEGRSIFAGVAEGKALVSKQGISFLGGVDPDTGEITEVGHELRGEKVTGKVLVVPSLKGSAGGLWILIRMASKKTGPKAIIIPKVDTILIGAVIMGEIPTIDSLVVDPFKTFKSGDSLRVDGIKGTVELIS